MRSGTFLAIAVFALALLGWQVFSVVAEFVEKERALAAVFLNDSQIVEFTGATENSPPVGNQSSSWPIGNSTIVSDSVVNLGALNTPPSGTTEEGEESILVFNQTTETDGVTPVIQTVTGVGTAGATTPSSENEESPEAPPEQTFTVEQILNALLGSQAITAVLQDAPPGGGVFGSGESGVRLQFFGGRIRDAFRALGIVALVIPNREALLKGTVPNQGTFSQQEFALFVASATLQDENIDTVTFANGTLTTRYRALGRLFGVVPMRYPLHIEATFTSGTLASVRVRFPWYSFFLAKGASGSALKGRIEAQIVENTRDFSSEYDIATRAFVGIADVLRTRLGGI